MANFREMSEWRPRAVCKDLDPAVFFPDTPEGEERAKALCGTCPVRTLCLDFALATRQDDGVWGGTTELERRRIRRRRQTNARRANKRGNK